MDKILLIGGGGHANACADVIEEQNVFTIAGVVEKTNSHKTQLIGYPIVGYDDDLEELVNSYQYAIVTVGQIKSSMVRKNLFNKLQEVKFIVPTVISPRAYVSKNAVIGSGTIIMHDSLVNSHSKVGLNCIVNNKSLIEHDTVVGDHCHVSTGAIINGCVKIGDNTFIGSRAVVHDNITIGSNCIISAGSVVRKSVKDNQRIIN